MKKNISKILIGFLLGVFIFVLCSYTYKVNRNEVDVRTVYEDGHKYVVASMTNTGYPETSGVSIVHSANCPCLKNK